MKKLGLFIATLVALVACTRPAPFVPALEVSHPEILAVPATGGTIKIEVSANVPYTVTSEADYVKATPETVPAQGTETVKTTIKIEVGANVEEQGREFDVDITTVGYAPLDYTLHVTQAASEYEKALQVLDSDRKPFAGPIEATHEGSELNLVVNSTVSWVATSDVAWVTVDPQIGEVEGYVWTAKAIKVTVAANEGKERSGKITITPAPASGLAPVEVVVNQAEKPAPVPFTVDVEMISVSEYVGQAIPQYPDATCRITIFENPSKTVTAGYYGVWQSAAWSQAELDDPMEILKERGNAMEAEELAGLNGAAGADPCEWIWSKLNPGTEYVVVAGFVAEDGSTYTAYSKSTTEKEEDPGEADAAYTKWIGTYNFTVNGKTHRATISASAVNKSFIVDLSGADNSYIEDFAPVATWDKTSDKLTIAEQTMGQWTHPQYGTIVDHVYGMISYNGGHPLITGNGYPIASLSYNSGNVVIESAGAINITGLGEMQLVGMSLFGVASAGNMRYCDEADFMLFPVTLTKAAANAPAPAAVKSGKASLESHRKSFGAKKAVKVSNFVELR